MRKRRLRIRRKERERLNAINPWHPDEVVKRHEEYYHPEVYVPIKEEITLPIPELLKPVKKSWWRKLKSFFLG